ncbi:MAG: UDP-galactopyranose mutase [Kiritimatiellia bacterium]
MKYDYLIVGCGLYGTVWAERLANAGDKRVLIIDRRDHVGGNCHSDTDAETGIEYHTYGTHIFHCDNRAVHEYISRFAELNGYHHQVLTVHAGKVYQMPINLETINQFFNTSMNPSDARSFMSRKLQREAVDHPANLEEQAVAFAGKELYEAFIKGYTTKQWGVSPDQLPAEILKRLPVRYDYREDFFHRSRWQGIPVDGYTAMFDRMLDHPNIEVRLSQDFFDLPANRAGKMNVIYTGPIDRYFEYRHGPLEWRSIRLEKSVRAVGDFQGTSVMNYADTSQSFTRIHEPRHLHPERSYPDDRTVIFHEYPDFSSGADPFYPVRTALNLKRLAAYRAEASRSPGVIFGGRLGSYMYWDMDQAVEAALADFHNHTGAYPE